MSEATERLKVYCRERTVERFTADEILELLEEGETVDWILEQVLRDSTPDTSSELRGLLEELSAEVSTATAADPAPVVADVDPSGTPGKTLPDPEAAMPDMGDLQDLLPAGVDMGQLEELLSSPRGELMADFGSFCQERGAGGGEPSEEMQAAMQELHTEWLTTPREALDGKKPSELLGEAGLFPQKVETRRREAPKIGRNDPCPCGSGKKYKKCCGKGDS